MANFDMCKQKRCSLSSECKRQTAPTNKYGQIYGAFNQDEKGACKDFIQTEGHEKVNEITANNFTKS